MLRSSFYHQIFFTNILRILDERGMTQDELAVRSGISSAFISALTRGKANPSLATMEAIAKALDTALPVLLESTDLDREALDELAGGKAPKSLPPGFERVSAVLTSFQAYQVKSWDEANKRKIREIKDARRKKFLEY